jgi:two-component system, OmpR family, response regulator CpxR
MSAILVVDDHRDTCRLLQRFLRGLGRSATVVQSGEAAVALVRDSAVPPDLILLDIMMPGMDGFETLAQIRALPNGRSLAVVMLSAVSDDESRSRAKALGANDYWVKGTFDPRHFEEMLDRFAPAKPAAA